MMHPFSERISRSGNLQPVFFMADKKILKIKGKLQNDRGKILISESGSTPEELKEHESYTRAWLKIFAIYVDGEENSSDVPEWWRAGLDDLTLIPKSTINHISFKDYYAKCNWLDRKNTQVLADSLANIALVNRDKEAFIVPLHLTILTDIQSASAIESIRFIPYPAISSILDLYSNRYESDDGQVDEKKAMDQFVKSWYPAVHTAIQQGFTIYRKMVVGERHWPEKLYFRWAVDLSPVYDAHYARPEVKQSVERISMTLEERLVGGGSCGAAFALAAAQALARADRRGMFSVK